jgi:hypothetical protein
VQAASEGDLAEIERLVAAGANLAGTAPFKVSPRGPKSLISQMLGGGPLSIPISPLHAAIAARQVAATQRLIELEADLNGKHPLLGTPVHAAVTAGDPQLLQVLLDAGAAVNELNVQRQTPLATLRGLRQMASQLEQFRSYATAFPDNVLSQIDALLPAQGWDECERLLLEHGGR